jgi:hypothetical protein
MTAFVLVWPPLSLARGNAVVQSPPDSAADGRGLELERTAGLSADRMARESPFAQARPAACPGESPMWIAALISFATLTGAPAVHATPQAPTSVPPTIILSLTRPSDTTAKVGVRSGERATAGLVNGPLLGLTPTLAEDGRVELVIEEITTDPQTGSEVTRELDRRVLELREPVRFDHETFWITVTWLDMRQSPASASQSSEPCKTCCVVCQGEPTCACFVETPCGHCCCSAACGCDIASEARNTETPALMRVSTGCAPRTDATTPVRRAAAVHDPTPGPAPRKR